MSETTKIKLLRISSWGMLLTGVVSLFNATIVLPALWLPLAGIFLVIGGLNLCVTSRRRS
jgi:hypothetical protein